MSLPCTHKDTHTHRHTHTHTQLSLALSKCSDCLCSHLGAQSNIYLTLSLPFFPHAHTLTVSLKSPHAPLCRRPFTKYPGDDDSIPYSLIEDQSPRDLF